MAEKKFVDQFMSALTKLPCVYPIQTKETTAASNPQARQTHKPSEMGSSASLEKEIQVIVKTLGGSQHAIAYDPSHSVYELKCLLEPMVNVAVEDQRLILRGKALLDEHALHQYLTDGLGEQPSVVIHLVERPIPAA